MRAHQKEIDARRGALILLHRSVCDAYAQLLAQSECRPRENARAPPVAQRGQVRHEAHAPKKPTRVISHHANQCTAPMCKCVGPFSAGSAEMRAFRGAGWALTEEKLRTTEGNVTKPRLSRFGTNLGRCAKFDMSVRKDAQEN